MSTSLACRMGRHHWEMERRQLDIDEPPRTVAVCSRCQKIDLGGSRSGSMRPLEHPHGEGGAGGFGDGGAGGGGDF